MLARRELSEQQVRQRLARKGHDSDRIEEAITRLRDERAIDDARVAEAIARTETATKRRGKLRVRMQIERAGIAKAVAKAATDSVFDALDDDALIEAALRKRLRHRDQIADQREFQRLYRFLTAQGFESERILRLLKRFRDNRRAMTSNELRASFLEYFAKNGHRIVQSSPLVPSDDPTLLFTNAGMNQFKDVFLGREKRAYTRATTSQKVMRVSGKHNDLDNVGPSFRHHTFFEMLGNFSFGDYFKKDAIPYAWTLLTDVWKMSPDRMVVSIFKGENGIPRDDEAYEIWRKFVPADRILELGTDDNFWQMGETGPCGRCSEIYYVRGTGTDPEIEIWNNVFMEFERSADGTLKPLPAPSIDTGMGLERITAVMQRKDSNYDTDLFMPLLTRDRPSGRASLQRQHGTVRYFDARGRGPHPLHDVPDRRRRHSVERVPRLRLAKDHAESDAPRQTPGLRQAIPGVARRRARARDGRRLSGAAEQSRNHRTDHPCRRTPVRSSAHRGTAPPRGRAERRSRAPRAKY